MKGSSGWQQWKGGEQATYDTEAERFSKVVNSGKGLHTKIRSGGDKGFNNKDLHATVKAGSSIVTARDRMGRGHVSNENWAGGSKDAELAPRSEKTIRPIHEDGQGIRGPMRELHT